MPRMLNAVFAVALGVVLASGAPAQTATAPKPPQTPKKPVTDEYHGVKVVDDYRWLENWEDPAVKQWSEAQNAYARSILDNLPAVADIRARLTHLETGASMEYTHLDSRAGRLFAVKHQPPKQQPFLVVLKSPNDLAAERVLVDPNVIDAEGHTTIDWYVPSHDGRLVAVSLSHGGTESGDVHVFDVETGKPTGDVIRRVNGGTAGGSLAWKPDGGGFYYTRYPREGERPKDDMDFYVQVYSHKLGDPPEKDAYETGKDFPRIAEILLESAPDGRVLANVQNGDGGEFIQSLRGPDGTWTQFSKYEDRVIQAVFGPDSAIYIVSRKDAPRGKILRLEVGSGAAPDLARAREIVPENDDAIETNFFGRIGIIAGKAAGSWENGAAPARKGKLYVWYQTGGPNEVRTFDLAGKSAGALPSLPISTVAQVLPLDNGDVLFNNESFVQPPGWYLYSGVSAQADRTAMHQTSPADYSDCEVVRETATSKDGTKVPISVIRKKGAKLDGNNPTVIWGYGGYSVSETPSFSPRRRVFVEQGGVFAIANIRGGGEFGEEWHRSGNLTKKQNVFDDFYAACKHLIDKGYTRREKLAIMGGSNGGLLMGATFTQHPDLAACVVSSVGIYDMLRVELSPNGAFNVTEFGTVKNPEHFKAMFAYSPYHHVKDAGQDGKAGQKYPPILFLTGANDPRVDPMQSRKMTARLQAAHPENQVLLRTRAGGHGIGASMNERIEQSVDIYAFIMAKLGVTYRRPGSGEQ